MPRMNVIRFLLLCLSIVGAYAFAEPPRSADPEGFDVVGIRTGMSQVEAVDAVTKKMQIDKKSIKYEKELSVNPVTNAKGLSYFSVEVGLVSVVAYFEPNVPYNKNRPMLVSMVKYEQPWTPDNVAAMKKAAIEKYGQPSNGTVGAAWQWCLHPDINPGNGCSDDRSNGIVLELTGTTLTLSNTRHKNARIEFMNKLQGVSPVF